MHVDLYMRYPPHMHVTCVLGVAMHLGYFSARPVLLRVVQ